MSICDPLFSLLTKGAKGTYSRPGLQYKYWTEIINPIMWIPDLTPNLYDFSFVLFILFVFLIVLENFTIAHLMQESDIAK
jgi:hypothetical protein